MVDPLSDANQAEGVRVGDHSFGNAIAVMLHDQDHGLRMPVCA
jgi:hypothetical protein